VRPRRPGDLADETRPEGLDIQLDLASGARAVLADLDEFTGRVAVLLGAEDPLVRATP